MMIRRFLERLAHINVLDPACGSGNFLYVTLQKLKDLEKEVIVFAMDRLEQSFLPMVGPWQLHGIEISPYAYDLAQMTVWIGYLQWTKANGFGVTQDPVLRPMEGNFQCKDAILDLSDPESPREPDWPHVDFIIGNPPFLGTKKLRGELGDLYVDALFRRYANRIPNFSDLCCYWFEKARAQIQAGKCKRAGLLATQGIRGGLNREVLKRTKESGDIFWAESDREWILDGANVHVSMIGFDDGAEAERRLDGCAIQAINSNLTANADITEARRLPQNAKIGFIADIKSGKFEITDGLARRFLSLPNPHGAPNSDVILPWINSLDLLRRPRDFWIVDFGVLTARQQAALYEGPFELVERLVLPKRAKVKRKRYREWWWLHAEPCPAMRKATAPLVRFVVTPTVSKHRIFGWCSGATLPDHQLVVFARSDDYFFGVLHSRLHEVWALRLGTRLETRPRYTPTTCFETFPFPWPPGAEPASDELVLAIAEAARELCELRDTWLNPPEWTNTEVLEFPGSVDGPWARYVHEPDARGIGTVRYPRTVAKDAECEKKLKKRTLTDLYNDRPTWLDLAHKKLDKAVFAAYGWNPEMTDEEVLEKLLALNLQRAKKE